MEIWKEVFKNKDQETAKKLDDEIDKVRQERGFALEKFAEILEYPIEDVWTKGNVKICTSHFRRILVEIKILAIWGKTFVEF